MVRTSGPIRKGTSLLLVLAILTAQLLSASINTQASDTKDDQLKFYTGSTIPSESEFEAYDNANVLGVYAFADGYQSGTLYYNNNLAADYPILKRAIDKADNIQIAAAGRVTQYNTRATLSIGDANRGGEERKGSAYAENQYLRSSKWVSVGYYKDGVSVMWSSSILDAPKVGELSNWERAIWDRETLRIALRDDKAPKISAVSLVSASGMTGNKITNGSRVVMDVSLDEPINPTTASALQFSVGGIVLDDLRQDGIFDDNTRIRYSFTIPDGISSSLMQIKFRQEGGVVTDYFGGNLLVIGKPTYLNFTIETERPYMTSITSGASYTDNKAYISGNDVLLTIEFNEELVMPDGKFEMLGAIYRTADDGVSRTDEVLKEFKFTRRSSSPITNKFLFGYRVEQDDPEGIIDLRGAIPYQNLSDGRSYWDIRPCIVKMGGEEQYDFSTVYGKTTYGPRMDPSTAFLTDFAVAGEDLGAYGTVIKNSYSRGKMPNLSLVNEVGEQYGVGFDGPAQSHTIYAVTDKALVYSPSTTLFADICNDLEENVNRADFFAYYSDKIKITDTSDGPISGSGSGKQVPIAVNITDTDSYVSGVKITAEAGIEETVYVGLKATDVSGRPLALSDGSVPFQIDTKAPRIKPVISQGISGNTGVQTSVAYSLSVEDMSAGGSEVFYQYVEGDGALVAENWSKAQPDGEVYVAATTVSANTLYSGRLFFYGIDGSGNESEPQNVSFFFNNSEPFESGNIIETSATGAQEEHSVTFEPSVVANYDIYYSWTLIGEYGFTTRSQINYKPKYDGSIEIGSYADQQQWLTGMGNANDCFEGKYRLDITAEDPLTSDVEFAGSYEFEFDNYKPVIDAGGIPSLFYGDSALPPIRISNGGDIMSYSDSKYEIRRPGSVNPADVYAEGPLVVNAQNEIPLGALDSGYYELYIKAEDSKGADTYTQKFMYRKVDGEDADFEISNLSFNGSEKNVTYDNGIYYIDRVGQNDSVYFNVTFSAKFCNYDLMAEKKVQASPYTLYLGDGFDVSYDSTTHMLSGSAIGGLGAGNYSYEFRLSGRLSSEDGIYGGEISTPYKRFNFANRNPAENIYLEEAGGGADYKEYTLTATREGNSVPVKDVEIISVGVKDAYDYGNFEYPGMTVGNYGSNYVQYDFIGYELEEDLSSEAYDDYIELIGTAGNYTGIRVKDNCYFKIKATAGYENEDDTNATVEFPTVTVDSLFKVPQDIFQTLRVNMEYEEEVFDNNTYKSDMLYPVDSLYHLKRHYGYERFGVEFYSERYEVLDFALMATNETTPVDIHWGERYGGDIDLDGDGNPNDHESIYEHLYYLEDGDVKQEDIDRFNQYMEDGKLSIDEGAVSVRYGDPYHDDVVFQDIRKSYRIEIKDLSEFYVFYLACKVKISDGVTKWTYIPFSYAPSVRKQCLSAEPQGTLADDYFKPAIDFTDADKAGLGKALGYIKMRNASIIVDWAEVADIVTPDVDSETFQYSYESDAIELRERLLERLKEIDLRTPISDFTHDLEVVFTPNSKHSLLVANLGATAFNILQFGAEDYNITFASSDVSVKYYENYAANTEIVNPTRDYISLYADPVAMENPKDYAVTVEPGNGETEFYYIVDSSDMKAEVDVDFTEELTQTDIDASGISEEAKSALSQLISEGVTVYKKIKLIPSGTETENPFGTVEISAVNIDRAQANQWAAEFTLPITLNIDASAPLVTYQTKINGDSLEITITAADAQTGVASLTVEKNGVDQSGKITAEPSLGIYYYQDTYDNAIENIFEVQAVNTLGMKKAERKEYAAGSAPMPPVKGIDYAVKYQYKNPDGVLCDVVAGVDYGIVYGVIEILREGVTIDNNDGLNLHPFIPGGQPSFSFVIRNGNGTTSEQVSYTMQSAADFARVDYSPKTANAKSVTIDISVSGADMLMSDISLYSPAGSAISLSRGEAVSEGGKIYHNHSAVVYQNGEYAYQVSKDGIILKAGAVLISNISASSVEFNPILTFSTQRTTYNNVVVGVSANKQFTVQSWTSTGTGNVQQISNTVFMFTNNDTANITCRDGDGNQRVLTAQVSWIDKTPPEVTLTEAYGENNAYAEVGFTSTTDALSDLRLSSLMRPDEGKLTGSSFSLDSLDNVRVKIVQNGIYRFTFSDSAGNIASRDIHIAGIDDTKPAVTNVSWEYTGTSKSVTPTDEYVNISTVDNPATNEDVEVTIRTNKEVTETGFREISYRNEFVKTLITNINAHFVFEDRIGNATGLRLRTDIIDKGFPVIEFPNGDNLVYFASNKGAYSKEDLLNYTVGDYKDGVYTGMDKNKVSISYGTFNPDDIDANTFDFRSPYSITYTVTDDAGNSITQTRTVRLFGKQDMCVLINGELPTDNIFEVFNGRLELTVENYSGELFVSYANGDYNMAQMKTKGIPVPSNQDGKSFTINAAPRRWYTVMVRTGTMEMFSVRVWVN